MDSPNRISLTHTVARQTPHNEFGNVLKSALQSAASTGGALIGALPGGGIISAAVSNVTALASNGGSAHASMAATGISTVGAGGGATGQAMATSPNGVPGELTGMIGQMRAEADRSTMMQMQMQQESREYNTISNVLKVRHDSAKSAINNIR
jgi:flagellar motor component MotA